MSKQGRRAKVKPVEPRFLKGQYVKAETSKQTYYGEVRKIVVESATAPIKYVIKLDDGKKIKIREPLISLLSKQELDELEELEREEENKGFAQYPINWDPQHINFAFRSKGIKFNGWWRKRAFGSFAVDLFAKTEDGKDIAVDCLTYHGEDPRENRKSLDKDICAAVNKWFHVCSVDDGTTLEKLRKRAEHPTIHIRRLESLDRMLLTLQEFRTISCRAGGQRYISIRGDRPKDPEIVIDLNLTPVAIALDGRKPPNMYEGAMYDGITGKRGEKVQGRKIEHVASPENRELLVKQLNQAKKDGNISEARKIRAVMRKMGIKRGGKV